MKTAKETTAFADAYGESGTDPKNREHLLVLMQELTQGLQLYWRTADTILAGSGITLAPVSEDYFSLERNFFSSLFLYSYARTGIPSQRRVAYVAVNQCLRGMVTGCDNVLDDEYKKTLETDLPAEATRFRSMLDIMVSDRVLFDVLAGLCRRRTISLDVLMEASRASLRALTPSGAEEACEEAGVRAVLSPEAVLRDVHHFKTGTLFECTWAIPSIIEGNGLQASGTAMKNALYRIGMGCQVFDDIVDLFLDIGTKRHNYVASLAHGSLSANEWTQLPERAAVDAACDAVRRFYEEHPDIGESAYGKALDYLQTGLAELFSDGRQFLVEPAIRFIAGRIGIDRVLEQAGALT